MSHSGTASDELTLLVNMASTQECVIAVDSACRIVFLNEHAEALLGYRASDVLGCCCYDALHLAEAPGSQACAMCMSALGVTGAQPSSGQYVAYATTQSGVSIWLRVLALPASNAVGERRTVHVLRAFGPGEVAHEDATSPATTAFEELDQSRHAVDGADGQVNPSAKSRLLTRRELEVLKLLASGLSNAYIAAQLSISPVTARNHVTSIIEKLGAKTRLQAVVMASRMGLLSGGTL